MDIQSIEKIFRSIIARKEELSSTFEAQEIGGYQKISKPSLWLKILKKGGDISWNDFNILAEASELVPHYNVAKEWLEKLPNSKEIKDPFSRLSNMIVLDNPQPKKIDMLKLSLKNWFVGAVKAIYNPGYIPKYTIVLVGERRMGKSSFLRSFIPEPLRSLVVENPCCGKKGALATKVFGLIEEIGNWIEKNSGEYRGFLTGASEGKRITSFLASCQNADFLKESWDERFLPFWLEKIWNRKAAEEVGGRPLVAEDFPMEEVWVEALNLYKEGYEPDFSFEEIAHMQNDIKNQFKRKRKEDIFWKYFDPSVKVHPKSDFWTCKKICKYLTKRKKTGNFSPTHIGRYLTSEGLTISHRDHKRGFWLIEKYPEKEIPETTIEKKEVAKKETK